MKKIWILTLFPEYFTPLKEHGVIGKVLSGERTQKVELNIVSISDYCKKSFKGVDSPPYGGGPGVVMRADVLKNALFEGVVAKGKYNIEDIKSQLKIVFTSPRGVCWDNNLSKSYGEFIEKDSRDLVFICGRYEGIDERFIENYIDEIISIGDFVLSGGELAVMVILDSCLRFLKGALGNLDSAKDDSFEELLIEGPCYTRPANFDDIEVPKVLTSGDHKKISQYHLDQKIRMTKTNRPDLYKKYERAKKGIK